MKEILKLCPARQLVTLYKIPSFDSVDDFLQKVATIRGKLKKGGIVDTEAAARIILHDWNEGMCTWILLKHKRRETEACFFLLKLKIRKNLTLYPFKRNVYLHVSGKIPYYTMPPVRDQGEPSEAKIVSEFSKEFNIDEVYNSESSFIGSLKPAGDFDPVEVPSSCPLTLDETMFEVCS